jgi:hypothetical protein
MIPVRSRYRDHHGGRGSLLVTLLLTALTAGCGERAETRVPDRRPWRCYTLQFGAWHPGTPRASLTFLPGGVELDAVLIAPATPSLGLRINALSGDHVNTHGSWRPLVPDTIELRFSAAEGSEVADVVVKARTDDRAISGIAATREGATAQVSGRRLECR